MSDETKIAAPEPVATTPVATTPVAEKPKFNAKKSWGNLKARQSVIVPIAAQKPNTASDLMFLAMAHQKRQAAGTKTASLSTGVAAKASQNAAANSRLKNKQLRMSKFKAAAMKTGEIAVAEKHIKEGKPDLFNIMKAHAEKVKKKDNHKLDMYHHGEIPKFMIMPTSHFATFWDTITALLVLYICFQLPYSACFNIDESDGFFKFISTFMDIFFWMDMVLHFRTAFIHNGHVITDCKEIAHHYFHSWFFIDLMGNIPWEKVLGDLIDKKDRKSAKIIKLLKLPRLLRFGRVLRQLGNYFRFRHFMTFWVYLIMMWHWLTCFYAFSIYDFDCRFLFDKQWPTLKSLMIAGGSWDEDYADPFTASELYFNLLDLMCQQLMGMETVKAELTCAFPLGNGTVVAYVASNPNVLVARDTTTNVTLAQVAAAGWGNEQLVGQSYVTPAMLSFIRIIASFCSMYLLAKYIAANVHIMISSTSAHDDFRKKMDGINQEMDQLNLSADLKKRVKRYYDYLWINQRAGEGVQLYKDPNLSSTLRNQVSMELVNGEVPLRKSEMLSGCSDLCLAKLADHMKTHVFMSEDCVIAEGEVGRELYYITKGKVIYKSDAAPDSFLTLEKGAFFGEISLLLEMPMTYSVIAGSLTELKVLTKDDIMHVFKDFPEYEGTLYDMAVERIAEMMEMHDGLKDLYPVMVKKRDQFREMKKMEQAMLEDIDDSSLTDAEKHDRRLKSIERSLNNMMTMMKKLNQSH